MNTNHQPIEKSVAHLPGDRLDVHSIFYTIQGEGPFAGRPAVFVRLAGCNLQCPRCDTDYTSNRSIIATRDMLTLVRTSNYNGMHPATDLVVLTGGEPFRQNITDLVRRLVDAAWTVQIETNGTRGPSDLDLPWWVEQVDLGNVTIVCSPKAGRIARNLSPLMIGKSIYKYVLNARMVDPDDGLPVLALDNPASPHVARPPTRSWERVYVQPMDAGSPEENNANLAAAVASCMRYGYRLCVQVHKIIHME